MFFEKRIFFAVILMTLFGSTNPLRGEKPDEPIQEIVNVEVLQQIFNNADVNRPIVIRSEADAAKCFSEPGIAKLKESVDFKKQVVVVFAWRGSGQDRLSFDVAESFPEQIQFALKRGFTRDLRSHVRVFALRSNVTWQTPNGEAGPAKGEAGPAKGTDKGSDESEYIKVEVKGRLNSQTMAIGGETTGITITSGGVTWELDLGGKAELGQAAKKLHDKTVIVTGKLTQKAGVEIQQRWIVNVSKLVDAKK